MNVNTVRNSNIELLRIFAMFLIIAHHFGVHGIYKYWHLNNSLLLHINNFFAGLLCAGGKIGVVVFVMITGYFMINSGFKLKNFLNIYLKTLFYSVLFLLLSFLYGEHQLYMYLIKMSVFPAGKHAYWFVTTYLVLYLFIPYINVLIKTISKEKLLYLIILTSFLWIFAPELFNFEFLFSHLAIFIYFYLIGACIRLKYFDFLTNMRLLKILFTVSLIYLSTLTLITVLKPEFNFFQVMDSVKINSLATLFISLFLFNYFASLKIGYNKWINWIASSVFSVYLIHDNQILRPFLWHKLISWAGGIKGIMLSEYFIFKMILIVIFVFAVCTIFDKCFYFVIKKPFESLSICIENLICKFKMKLQKLL